MKNVRYVTARELGNCPASVRMDNGLIEINADVWDRYSDFEKSFIIEHEIGHFTLQTDNETEADIYALHRVYKTVPGSLKKSLQTLYKIGVITGDRLENLYKEALRLDVLDNGNIKAKNELKNLGVNKMNTKRSTGNSPFVNMRSNRADGAPAATTTTGTQSIAQAMRDRFMTESGLNNKRTGIVVGEHFLSYEVILLAVMLVITLTRKS
ncbi:MAG: hypothetical protein RBT49_11840 [Bacteroidales bacterium]|jgi:hypothetical protein|nr:hypothetical protein [Bacteroidales bacterium]